MTPSTPMYDRRWVLKMFGASAVAASSAGFLAACGGSDSPGTAGASGATGKPKPGGTLRVALAAGAPTETLDPHKMAVFPDWGHGFQLASAQLPNRRSSGSGTWAGVFNTHFFIDPSKELGVIVMMQTLPFYDDGAIHALQNFEEAVYRSVR